MKLPRISLRWTIVGGLLLAAVAVVLVPFLNADRYSRRVLTSLETALGRKVEIGEVHFSLFRGPGFTLDKVVIYDDPAIGAEPIAYVTSMEARVRLRTLWTGEIEFSSLRLSEPSVNIVKSAAGPWNFEPLLVRAAGANLPELHVRNGRLNFKSGDTKSVFYLTGTDLDIDPPSRPGGAFQIRFSGAPARTDRPAHGFGEFSGQCRWQPTSKGRGGLDLNVKLERSAVSDLVTLLRGQDLGVQGLMTGRLRLRGPVDDHELGADVQLEDIHRWDVMPPYAQGGPLRFRGKLNLVSQELAVETVPEPRSALLVRFRAANYLSKPEWGVNVAFKGLPVARVLDVARHMGFTFTQSIEAEGVAAGVVGYSPTQGVQGSADLRGTKVKVRGGAPFVLEEGLLVVSGNRIHLAPALVRSGDGKSARIEADYQQEPELVDLKITTDEFSMGGVGKKSDLASAFGPVPLAGDLRDGTWGGALRYQKVLQQPGEWSGTLHLSGGTASITGFAEPLVVEKANVALSARGVSVTDASARLGEIHVEGEYHHDLNSARPVRVQCKVRTIAAADIERLLMPTLNRNQGLLSRALGIGRTSPPDWLKNRRMEGILQIGKLTIHGREFSSVRAHWFWDQTRIDFTRIAAKYGDGRFDGHLKVDIGGPEPRYQLGASLESMTWRGGTVGGDVLLNTSGFGRSALDRLTAEGEFRGRSVALTRDGEIPSFSGCYDIAWSRNGPRLQLDCLRLDLGTDVLTGHGSSSEDGRVTVDLTGDAGPVRLTGHLDALDFRLERPAAEMR